MAQYGSRANEFVEDCVPESNEQCSLGRTGRRWNKIVAREILADVLTFLNFSINTLTVATSVVLTFLAGGGTRILTVDNSGIVGALAPPISVATGGTGATTLTQDRILLGNAAGAVAFAAAGTTTTVLHGNAAGVPAFGAVVLTTDVSGTLPVGNGGTGFTTATTGDLVAATGANVLGKITAVAINQVLTSAGASTLPVYTGSPTLTALFLLPVAGAATLVPGRLSRQTGSVGTGADTTEDILFTYTVPAALLAANGNAVRIRATFTTAANGNNKTARLRFGGIGGTILIASAVTPLNAGTMFLEALVIRTGAATQDSWGHGLFSTASAANDMAITFAQPTQTLSGTVDIVATGQNGTASANDILCKGLEVIWEP